MKQIRYVLASLLLSLVTASGVCAQSSSLWTKVEKAEKEGKPQTAAGYLKELESGALSDGDSLELFYIAQRLMDNLSRYDWREASTYRPTVNALERHFLGDSLDAMVARYRGHSRVMMLIFEQLQREKTALDRKNDRSGEDYLRLRSKCLESAIKHSGSEYCEKARELVRQMDSRSFSANGPEVTTPGETSITITSRNVPEAAVTLWRMDEGADGRTEGSVFRRQALTEFANEYNVSEKTVFRTIFDTPGIYVAEFDWGGSDAEYVTVHVTNVAGALRRREGRIEIYAADLNSGQPFDEASVTLFRNGKSVGRQSLTTDGFTPLTTAASDDGSYADAVRIENGCDIYAPPVNIHFPVRSTPVTRSGPRLRTAIFTDRSLYSPGDTVRFKVICYRSDGESGETIPDKSVAVKLYGESDDTPLSFVQVTTGPMGSASGSLAIPEDVTRGLLYIRTDENAVSSVRVETVSRPTFEVTMDPVTEAVAYGDVVLQKGSVRSYAGYQVSGAVVSWSVIRSGGWRYGFSEESIAAGKVISEQDGSFSIPFVAERPEGGDDRNLTTVYVVEVKVTDPSGETHAAGNTVTVSDRVLVLDIELPDNEYADDRLILDKDMVRSFRPVCRTAEGALYDTPIAWSLVRSGKEVISGQSASNNEVNVDFTQVPSGEYEMQTVCNFRGRTFRCMQKVVVLSGRDTKLPFDSEMFFYRPEGVNDTVFSLGTSEDNLYVEAELFDGDSILWREKIHLRDEMRQFTIPYSKDCPRTVTLSIFGFRNGHLTSRTATFSHPQKVEQEVSLGPLPETVPAGGKSTLAILAPEGSELTVTIYDATCDRFGVNSLWFHPLSSTVTNTMPIISTMLGPSVLTARSSGLLMMANGTNDSEQAVDYSEEDSQDSPVLRENPAPTLGFFPHVTADADGRAEVTFDNGELLSTFRVKVLSHDNSLRTGNAETSFTVTKPLMVLPQLPLFAVEGDLVTLKSRIVNLSGEALSGRARIEVKDKLSGRKVRGLADRKMTLLSGAREEVGWAVEIPSDIQSLQVSIWFESETAGDGQMQTVTVVPDETTVTETASFVIGDHSRRYYEKKLKKATGRSDANVSYAEYSTHDAVTEALPKAQKPETDNVLEWTSQLFIELMGSLLRNEKPDETFRSEAMAHIAAFQSPDGGLRWFDRMASNRTATLFFLEKAGQMKEAGAFEPTVEEMTIIKKALGYIDAPNLLDLQSAAVRSLWPDVPMEEKTETAFQKLLSDSAGDWQHLDISDKTRLCSTLLHRRETGAADAGDYEETIQAIAASLKDHAVVNSTAGCSFPNAVTHSRGLMNNDIYAHCQILDLFKALGDKKMVNGIAQWLLLQKHNRAWESSAATADAVYSLRNCGAEDLRLGAVFLTYTTGYSDVTASANGLEVKRTYLHEDGTELRDGEAVHVGDRITARYTIYNDEKRSFVRMNADHPAAFYPVDERSGFAAGGARREVCVSSTSYWWELLPEEQSVLEEDFYVSREGVFSAGLVRIESLYAPEYCGHTGSLTVTSL